MALVLKQNKTYTYKGLDIPNPYLVIDHCNGSKCPTNKVQTFTVQIFTSQADRANQDRIIYSRDFTVTGENWEAFFSVAAINADKDQYSRAYEYIKQLTESVQTGVDEQGVPQYEDVLIYQDWEDSI